MSDLGHHTHGSESKRVTLVLFDLKREVFLINMNEIRAVENQNPTVGLESLGTKITIL